MFQQTSVRQVRFYLVDPVWRRLPADERADNRREFYAVVGKLALGMFVRSFSLVGLRADADFLLWKSLDTLEQLQESAARLRSTALGRDLSQPYSYLALTHPLLPRILPWGSSPATNMTSFQRC